MKVYVISEECADPLVKIGISGNTMRRLASLRSVVGQPLRLVFEQDCPDARVVERLAHHILRDKRRGGEWFAVSSNEACDAIREALEQCRSPGWRPPWEGAVQESKHRHDVARQSRSIFVRLSEEEAALADEFRGPHETRAAFLRRLLNEEIAEMSK